MGCWCLPVTWFCGLSLSLLSLSSAYLVQPEINALQAFYDSTDGSYWTYHYPLSVYGQVWNFSTEDVDPCDHWQGISCSVGDVTGLQTVLSLNLSAYNLSGSLPASLSVFTALTSLNLASNSLTGSMPAAICEWGATLRYLNLQHNYLSGSLPACMNQTNYAVLYYLSFHANELTGSLPDFLIPPPLLVFLSLSVNYISGTVPGVYTQFPAVRQLYLSDNLLSGSLPQSYSYSHIISMAWGQNLFTGRIPASIGSLVTLEQLWLDQCMLTGPLPSSFGQLTKLVYLLIYLNHLTGTLPDFFTGFQSLIALGVDDNYFTGTLPPSLANAHTLQQFSVYNNLLSGTLPAFISQFSELTVLLVSHNAFHGSPAAAFNQSIQKTLTAVNIASNKFTGTLPQDIFSPALRAFSSFQVCFSGSIPEFICKSTHLQTLVLDGFTSFCAKRIWLNFPRSPEITRSVPGTIPDCIWTELPDLYTFSASGNGLLGSIPSLTKYANLSTLDLSYNSLTGTIPVGLQTWTRLRELNLLSNKIVGKISEIGALTYSYTPADDATSVNLTLANNRLAGIIPWPLYKARNIDILESNMFSCSDHHQPPIHDPDSSSFVCGSNFLDLALGVFAIVVCVLILIAIASSLIFIGRDCMQFARLPLASLQRQIADFLQCAQLYAVIEELEQRQPQTFWTQWQRTAVYSIFYRAKLYDADIQNVKSYPNLTQFCHSLLVLRRISVLLMLVTLAIIMPVLVSMKGRYSTFVEQYRWYPSALFLSGEYPVAVILCLYVGLLSIAVGCIVYYIPRPVYVLPKREQDDNSADDPPLDLQLVIGAASRDGGENKSCEMDEGPLPLNLPSSLCDDEKRKSEADTSTESFVKDRAIKSPEQSPRREQLAIQSSIKRPSMWSNSPAPSRKSLVASATNPSDDKGSTSGGKNSTDPTSSNHPSMESNSSPAMLRGTQSWLSGLRRSLLRRSLVMGGSAKEPSEIRFETENVIVIQKPKGTIVQYMRRETVWISVLAILLNMITVLSIKALFIFFLVSYRSSYSVKISLEFMLAFVDVLYSAGIVPLLLRYLPKKKATGLMILKTYILYFNGIFAPLLVIAVVDSSCVNGLFVAAAPVLQQFNTLYCDTFGVNLTTSTCTQYNEWITSSYYTPQFFYNYTCYYAVLTEYTPIFFISYAAIALCIPLGAAMIVRYRRHLKATVLADIFPGVFWVEPRQQQLSSTYPQRREEEEQEEKEASTVVNHLHADPEKRQSHLTHANLHSAAGVASPSAGTAIASHCDGDHDQNMSNKVLGSAPVAKRWFFIASGRSSSVRQTVTHTDIESSGGESRTPIPPAAANDETKSLSGKLLFPEFILAAMLYHIIAQLTFGLFYPLLSFALALIICTTTVTWEMLMGRFLHLHDDGCERPWSLPRSRMTSPSDAAAPLSRSTTVSSSRSAMSSFARCAAAKLDEVCLHVCFSPRSCLSLVCGGSAFIVGLVLWDMAGDAVGMKRALWALFTTLAAAAVVYVLFGVIIEKRILSQSPVLTQLREEKKQQQEQLRTESPRQSSISTIELPRI